MIARRYRCSGNRYHGVHFHDARMAARGPGYSHLGLGLAPEGIIEGELPVIVMPAAILRHLNETPRWDRWLQDRRLLDIRSSRSRSRQLIDRRGRRRQPAPLGVTAGREVAPVRKTGVAAGE